MLSEVNRFKVHPYADQKAVLTSKHQKLGQIRPAFADLIGLHVVEMDLDTDRLGTFTGEIKRLNPPRETAILKARMGMDASGSSLGIASEGSIGPDPLIPFAISDIEHVVLVDDERNIVISETFRSFEITVATVSVNRGEDISGFLLQAGFPLHKLIVRPQTPVSNYCVKGIGNITQLRKVIEECSEYSPQGLVTIESDLRAHCSPTRQLNISWAALALALRVNQLCPYCNSPGWGGVTHKKGVKCGECLRLNSEAISQEILSCVCCDYKEDGLVIAQSLDPRYCTWCNP